MTEDIRWRDVYGSIKLVHTPTLSVLRIEIQVRFDGQVFTSKIDLLQDDWEYLTYQLDKMVDGIDDLMFEHGIPPYEIRGHE